MRTLGGIRPALSLVALAAYVAVALLPQHEARAQISVLPLDFQDVVIFATNSARLKNEVAVVAGHVVVNAASTGPTLSAGVELGVGDRVATPAGYSLAADSIGIGGGTTVGGSVFYNTLKNKGRILGAASTPLALPVFAPLPVFKSAPAGTQDISVGKNKVQTLAPGDYRDIKVEDSATLTLSPGVYSVRSIKVANKGRLLFANLSSGAAEVLVTNGVTTGDVCVVGPDDSDPLKASKIVFYVASSPPKPAGVDIGNRNTIRANIYAPNAKLAIDNDSVATGQFLARDVEMGDRVRVDLEGAFGSVPPAITSADATTFILGQTGSFTVTTTGTPTVTAITQGGALPAGVTFVDNGDGTGTLSGTPGPGTAGTYTLSFTAANGVPPDAVQDPFTLTVELAGTTTTLTSTVNPTAYGQSTTFTATVTPVAPNVNIPFGTVQFMDGASSLGAPVPLAGGVATLSTSDLSPGPHALTAVYGGDSSFSTSTGSLPTQTVILAATSTVLTSTVNPTVYGQSTTFTATVTVVAPGAGTPGGTVQFKDGVIDLGAPQALAGGVATLSTAALSAGGHAITAVYSGDVNFSTSTGSLPTQTVNTADTTTNLTSNNNPALAGAPVTFSATVSAVAPGVGVPTGSVDFLDGITLLGSGPLIAGVAQWTTSTLAPGVHGNINTTYAGDPGFNGSSGGPLSQTVNQAPTAVADNTYTTVHDTPLNVPVGSGILANDTLGFPVATIDNVTGNAVPCTAFPCTIATTQSGSATVQSDGSFAYTPPASFAGDDTFTYKLLNTTGESTATVTIAVTDARPVVDLNGGEDGIDFNAGFTEAGGAVPIVQTLDPDKLTVSDSDHTQLASATVVITNLLDGAAESLSVTCPDVLPACSGAILPADVVYTPGTGTLAITAAAPLADYEALLRTLTYDNASPNPDTTTRDITVTVNDGILDNAPLAHALVTVTAVNTAPVLANVEGTPLNYTVNDPATPLSATLTVSDADSPNLASATVRLTTNCVPADDVLSFANTAAISGNYSPATCLLTLTGADTPANYQAALRNVKYSNTNGATSTTARTATFQVDDGAGVNNLSNAVTRNINVQVNTPPVLAAIEGAALAYAENGVASAITATLTVADSDSPNLASATVQITTNCSSGEDVLSFTDQNGISGVYTAASCLMTLSGSSSVANYQAALRDVKYSNSSETPSTLTRTASFQANDGAVTSNLSNIVTRGIAITASNDAPVLTAGGTLNYTENDPATVIDATVTVSDADSADLTTATVQITGNYQTGFDLLACPSGCSGLSANFVAGTGTLTLTGAAPLLTYQAALRTVTFQNTSENPTATGATRTITWIGNDGALPSVGVTSTINVTAVNDAPTMTAGATLNYTENQAATAIDATITVADVDSPNLSGATVQITGNCASPEDVLSFTNQNGISGGYTAAGCLMTLSGSSTLANYQTALRSVRYNNSSENPSTLARTVTWRVDDGGGVNNLSNQPTSTINVTAVNDAPQGVAAQAHGVTGNVRIQVPAGVGLLVGVTDVEGNALTAQVDGSSAHAGEITINADGSYVYNPVAGRLGADTVKFKVCDNGAPSACSAAHDLTLTVADMLWFIDNSLVAGGDGRLTSPFNSIAGFTGINDGVGNHPKAGQVVFIDRLTATNYTGPLTLQNTQKVLGKGATVGLANFAGITLATHSDSLPTTGGTAPNIATSAAATNAINVASGNTLRGFTLGDKTGAGISGSNFGTLTISEVSISGAGQALNLTTGTLSGSLDALTSTSGTNNVLLTGVGTSGTFALSSGVLSGATSDALKIDGAAGSVSYSGTITNAGTLAVNILNKTGGTVTLSGDINPGGAAKGISISNNSNGTNITFSGANKKISTGTGPGVNLSTNAGATITFSGGGLAIATTSGAGFSATGGAAAVSVTGSGNTIASATGTALNVASTTIGAGGLTFQSISASGGANGIVLTNTGSSGGLTVTGDGTNLSLGGNGSGGTISAMAGADGGVAGNGVYLENTRNIVLRRMTINGANQNHGIRGVGVVNFTLEYSTVGGTNGTSAGLDEGSIVFDNLTGTSAITSSVIEGGFEDNLNIVNTTGTLNLAMTGSTFGLNNTANGNNNILLEAQNPGTTMNFTLQSSLIKGARTDFLNAANISGSTMSATVGGNNPALGNTFDNLGANAHPGAAAGSNRVVLGSVGSLTFDIRNNVVKGSRGEAIRVRSTVSLPTIGAADGHVRNNVIGVQATPNSGSAEGSGIFIFGDGGSDMTVAVANNSVYQYNNHGILVQFGDEISDGSLFNATVTGNTVASPGNLLTEFNGIHLNNGTVAATDNFTSCVDLGGGGALANNLVGSGQGVTPPNNQEFRLRQRQSTTVRLPGYSGANNNDAAVVAYVQGRNFVTGGNGAASNTVPTGGGGFVGGAACTAPSIP